jgi:hypothetical protein
MTPRTISVLAALLGVAGCASSSRVHEISPGVYAASVTADGYVSTPRLREDSLDRATEFCARQGKRMRLAREANDETHNGTDTTIRVTFRCIDG